MNDTKFSFFSLFILFVVKFFILAMFVSYHSTKESNAYTPICLFFYIHYIPYFFCRAICCFNSISLCLCVCVCMDSRILIQFFILCCSFFFIQWKKIGPEYFFSSFIIIIIKYNNNTIPMVEQHNTINRIAWIVFLLDRIFSLLYMKNKGIGYSDWILILIFFPIIIIVVVVVLYNGIFLFFSQIHETSNEKEKIESNQIKDENISIFTKVYYSFCYAQSITNTTTTIT